jgi:murein DD-endopeptidase MepM/ murein hydrolase activator NlpD
MTKNGKPFTFLLRRSNKNRIYFRRVEVSKGFIQNGALCIAFITLSTLLGGGLYGLVAGFPSIDIASVQTASPATASLAQTQPAAAPKRELDYSRPDASEDLMLNSGGPVDLDDFDTDNPELEKALKSIQANTQASFLPTIWPHASKINNEFGFRRNPFGGRTYEFHAGMDIDGERGDSVVAPGNGRVIEAGWKGGYGNFIEVEHGNGLTTRYGHLSKVEVASGDTVTRGQTIGLVGSTGRSTGPHLHYELRVNDRPINPRFFLPQEPTEIKPPTVR